MFLAPTAFARRKRFWRWAHYWSCVRLHKRLVARMLILGLLSGEVVSLPYGGPYEGKAVARVGSPDRCIHGCFVMPRGRCPVCAYEAAPLAVKVARKL